MMLHRPAIQPTRNKLIGRHTARYETTDKYAARDREEVAPLGDGIGADLNRESGCQKGEAGDRPRGLELRLASWHAGHGIEVSAARERARIGCERIRGKQHSASELQSDADDDRNIHRPKSVSEVPDV